MVHEPDAFVWLHFNLANQASIRWLRQRLTLPDAFDTALQHAASTRIEVAVVLAIGRAPAAATGERYRRVVTMP